MKKATPTGSPLHNTLPPDSTNTDAQELRLLAYLLTHGGGINRYEADRLLNICHLGGRVKGLEGRGCVIAPRVTETALDLEGRPHNGIKRYWLKSAPMALLQAASRKEVAP